MLETNLKTIPHPVPEQFSHQGYLEPDVPVAKNEDRTVWNEKLGLTAVIDGATAAISGEKDGLNSAEYAAAWLKRYLLAYTADKPAGVILEDAVRAFHKHLKAEWPDMFAQGALGPSASVVLLRIHADETFSFAQLGDCMLCFTSVHKEDKQCYYTSYPVTSLPQRHAELEQKLINLVSSILHDPDEGDYSLTNVRTHPQVMDMIQEQRALANREYGVFSAELECLNFINAGDGIDLEPAVVSFTLLSDGMFAVIDPEDHIPDHMVDGPEINAVIAAGAMGLGGDSIEDYYKESLYYSYCHDPEATKHPRLKFMDDASAVIVYL